MTSPPEDEVIALMLERVSSFDECEEELIIRKFIDDSTTLG
jgi:hypothetical protein